MKPAQDLLTKCQAAPEALSQASGTPPNTSEPEAASRHVYDDSIQKVLFGVSKRTPLQYQIAKFEEFDLEDQMNNASINERRESTRDELMFIDGNQNDIPPIVHEISIPDENCPVDLRPIVPFRLEYYLKPKAVKSSHNKTICFIPPPDLLFLSTFQDYQNGKVDGNTVSDISEDNLTHTEQIYRRVHINADLRFGNVRSSSTETSSNPKITKVIEDNCDCIICKECKPIVNKCTCETCKREKLARCPGKQKI